MNCTSFTFADLFAGIGGARLGFEQAGGTCVFACETDGDARRTYEENFGKDAGRRHPGDSPGRTAGF